MKLAEIAERLAEFDSEDTIYASEPWTEESAALVATEPSTDRLQNVVTENGMSYFLEISIAREIVEDWVSAGKDSSTAAICQRLIQYAVNDA